MEHPPATDADLSAFCCLDPSCDDRGKRTTGNLTVCDRIGSRRQYRLLRCRTCKSRFSERKGTVFFGSHLPPAKVVSILAHAQEGAGMRQTGRLVGNKEDTVIRYARLAGAHDELVAFPPGDPRAVVRREVVVRPEEGGDPRPRRPGRRRPG